MHSADGHEENYRPLSVRIGVLDISAEKSSGSKKRNGKRPGLKTKKHLLLHDSKGDLQ
jgi:hypothetical protein